MTSIISSTTPSYSTIFAEKKEEKEERVVARVQLERSKWLNPNSQA